MLLSTINKIIQPSVDTLKANTNDLENNIKKLRETFEDTELSLKQLIDYTPMIEFEVLSTQLTPKNIPLEEEE